MKKIFWSLILLVLAIVPVAAQVHSHGITDPAANAPEGVSRMRAFAVEEYTGVHWTVLMPEEKVRIVSGFLAGFSVWRDYIFDLDVEVYERYESYDEFLSQDRIAERVVADIDRYYTLNRDNYKFSDRLTNLIIVFYGKYWWQ